MEPRKTETIFVISNNTFNDTSEIKTRRWINIIIIISNSDNFVTRNEFWVWLQPPICFNDL